MLGLFVGEIVMLNVEDDVIFIKGLLLGDVVEFALRYVDGGYVGVLVGDSVSPSGEKPKDISISSPKNSHYTRDIHIVD